LQWDAALLDAFEIPPGFAANGEIEQRKSTAKLSIAALKSVPIRRILGDQQAALVGQNLLFSKGK